MDDLLNKLLDMAESWGFERTLICLLLYIVYKLIMVIISVHKEMAGAQSKNAEANSAVAVTLEQLHNTIKGKA